MGAQVVLLERDPALAGGLETMRMGLGASAVRVERAEALAWMRSAAPAAFDLVLLDPPVDADLLGPAVEAAARLVGQGGYVYVEGPAALAAPTGSAFGLAVWRSGRAGAVCYQLLRVGYTAGEPTTRTEP